MLGRRRLLAQIPTSALCLLGMVDDCAPQTGAVTLREVARSRGFEVGAFATSWQMSRASFREMLSANFTLAANLSDNMEWASNPGLNDDPPFNSLTEFLNLCVAANVRPRARNIYSHENNPPLLICVRTERQRTNPNSKKRLSSAWSRSVTC
jgi:hypothetical protein